MTTHSTFPHRPAVLIEALEHRALLAAAPIPVVGNQFTIIDTDSDIVTVKLTGPGTLNAADADADARISQINLTGTTTASNLKISVTKKVGGDGFVTLGDIFATSDLGQIDAAKAGIASSNLEFAGVVRDLRLGSLFEVDLTMGGDLSKSTKFSTLGAFNSSLQFGARLITSVNIRSVQNSDVNAGAINTWTSTPVATIWGAGDLSGLDLTLTGVAGITRTLGSMKFGTIAGSSDFNITGNVGEIIGRAINNVGIAVTGLLGTLRSTAGSIVGEISAQAFKTIRSAAVLNGEFSANSASANNGVSFGTISAPEVNAAFFVADKFFAGGRVGSFKAGRITALQMSVSSVGKFGVTGNAQQVTIDLRDSVRTQSLDTFSIGGTFQGNLLVRGNAGSLAFGAINNAVVLVGVVSISDNDFDDFRSMGMPDSDTGLFDSGAVGLLKSLTFIKPKSTSGFNAGNPNLGSYWIVARQINTLSSKGAFATASIGGTRFGIGTQLIKNASASNAFGSSKATNLDATKLQSFALDDPSLDIVNTADHTDISLVDPEVLADARLRLFK